MIKYINYQVGGMGQTMLAHTLFACEKIDLNVDTFFESTGRAHRIRKLNTFNDIIIATHDFQFTSYDRENHSCILNVYAEGWGAVLQEYLGFIKWVEDTPTVNSMEKFYNLKDNNVANFLELATLSNYHRYENTRKTNCLEINLLEYVNGDIDNLIESIKLNYGWEFNIELSDIFHKKMLQVNQSYLDLIDNLELISKNTLNEIECNTNLETWLASVVIAKTFEKLDISPALIKWDEYPNLMIGTNANLIEIVKEIKWVNHSI